MENLANVKNGVLAALSFVFGAVTQALGGWDVALQVLIGCMSVDYITGLVVAAVFQKSNKSESGALESRAGFKGLCRKGGVLCLVFVAAMLDSALGCDLRAPGGVLLLHRQRGVEHPGKSGAYGGALSPELQEYASSAQG